MTGEPVPRGLLPLAVAGDQDALDALAERTPDATVIELGLLLVALGQRRPRQPSEAARICAEWIDSSTAREPQWSCEGLARQWVLLARAAGTRLAVPADPDDIDLTGVREVARRAVGAAP